MELVFEHCCRILRAHVLWIAAVILPSLQRLQGNFDQEMNEDYSGGKHLALKPLGKKKLREDSRFSEIKLEREDECGICLEPCTKIVLPNCCHSMCSKCYRNWWNENLDLKLDWWRYVVHASDFPIHFQVQEHKVAIVPFLSWELEESKIRRFMGAYV